MSLATTLMAVGIPAEQANRLGYEDRVPLDGNGTTQAGATEIIATNTNIAMGTSAGDTAFILPAEAELFQPYFLLNTTAETALIFPPVGDTIDANAVNTAVEIETDLARVFMRVEEGRWVSMPSGEGGGGIETIIAGAGISVDNTDPDNPIVSNTGVLSVTAGSNVSITGTAQNPIINAAGDVSSVNGQTGVVVLGAADVGAVATIVAGSNITVDATDPQNPIVSSANPGGTVTAVSVASANGFAGSSSGGATPALTLSTTVNGVLQGNGTSLSALLGTTGYALIGNGVSAPSFQGFVQTGTGAATRTWQSKAQERVSVLDYGADPTGVADSAAAFQAAANTGLDVEMPVGTYKLNSTISITQSSTRFLGYGRGHTVLTTSSSGHGFSVATGLSYVEFQDFTLNRSGVPASASQNGIHFAGITERARIIRVEATGHWHNYRLCATSLSKIEDNFSDNAYGSGYYIANEDAVAAGLQWEVITCFAQRSNGYGIKWFSNFGTSAVVGPLVDFWSYANKLGGIIYQGTSGKPINGVRILGGFSGEEGGDSLYIDTYGTTESQVNGLETEINGTAAVGVNQSTPAPHMGRGITLTVNNTAALLTGCVALGNSYSGIVTSCPRVTITGCTSRGNGVAAVAGEQVGIYLLAGRAVVTGCSSLGQSTAAGFGIYVQADNGHTIVSNDVSESNTTPIAAAVPLINSILNDNYGSTYEQAPTTVTPTAGSGTFTSASATLKYSKNGKIVYFTATVIITTNGTAATYVAIPLPFQAEARSVCCSAFDETAVLGLVGYVPSSGTSVRIYSNTGTYPGANGKTLMVSGQYWVA